MIKGFFSRTRWGLHNPLKSWTLTDLTDHELKLLAGTLTEAERQLCLVWKKDWDQWRRITTVEGFSESESEAESLLQATLNLSLSSGAPPIPADALQTVEEITQVKIMTKEPQRLVQDRRHGRHEVRVPVEIIQGTQTFRTETLDISLSGVRFKDPIPDWVAGYFTVLFRLPQKSFEITCALVEDQKHKKDCAEVFDTNDEESGLKTFLDWVHSFDQGTAGPL